MKRLLNLTAVTGSLCLVSLLGCQQSDQEITRNPGALPRHNPPANAKVNATTLFAHAHLLERQGAFERAVVQYQKAIAEKPDFLTARNRLGITLNKLGRHIEASEQFEICIETQPSLAYLHNNLGFSRYLEGQYELSQVSLRQAIELDPEFSRARMNHAVVLSKLGRQQDAYNELMQIGSKSDACFNMGILLTEAGDFDSAAQYLEAALASNPKFEAARKQLHEVARLAAEHEARVATDTFAQRTYEPAPQVVTGTPVGGSNTPDPLPNDNRRSYDSVEVAEAPVSPVAPQPTRNQPVASNSGNIYGNSAPQQPSSFQANSQNSNTVASGSNANTGSFSNNTPSSSNTSNSVVVESAPSQPVAQASSPVVTSETPQVASTAGSNRSQPVVDPMSVSDTAGRGSNTPQPQPNGQIETIYVGASPVANSSPSTPTPSPTTTSSNTVSGTNSSAVTIEPVFEGSSSNTSTPVQQNSSTFVADPHANVEDDPACSDDNDDSYTVTETIDANQQNTGSSNPQPVEPVEQVADVTPVADTRPLNTASSSVIIEPVKD